MSPRSRRIGLAAASVILALACAKKAEEKAPAPAPPPPRPPVAASVQVTEVQLGNGIGADKRVSAPLDVFAPTDTIYASVATAGGSAVRRCRQVLRRADPTRSSCRSAARVGSVITASRSG